MSPGNRVADGNVNIQSEHLEEVSRTDPGGTEQEKYNNATVSLERFSR